MNRAVHTSSSTPLTNEILSFRRLPNHYRVKPVPFSLNLCPVELLCVMTVLFCVLRQLEPRLGAQSSTELGCWHHPGPDIGTKPDPGSGHSDMAAPVGRYQPCPVIAII